MKCLEYKEVIEKQKKQQQQKAKKYETMEFQLKKQSQYVNSQQQMIKDLKQGLEHINLGFAKISKKRSKVIIPLLDLSKVKEYNSELNNRSFA